MSMSTASNPFANFKQTSPLSTSPHDPMLSLASNCVRDYFGPTVQMVFDGLSFRGEPSTFSQLVATLRQKCRQKVYSEERIRLLGSAVASRLQNQSLQLPPLRASLLVLCQHSIVKVTLSKSKHKLIYYYQLDINRARLLPRYPRYVEYAKKALDTMAAALVEELLVEGRLRTVDVVLRTVEHLKASETTEAETSTSSRYTSRQTVLESFKRLVQSGFFEQVAKLVDLSEEETNGKSGENEFGEPQEPPKKRVKIKDNRQPAEEKPEEEEDPAIVALLQGGAYKDILPRGAVWRVNVQMFHDSLRAFCLGRLVAERYGHKIQSAGSMVTAALKYLAYKRHAEKNTEMELTFDAASILRYIPKAVLQLLEKKRKEATNSKNVSVVTAVARAFQQLSSFSDPKCVMEVETGGKPDDSKFEINTTRMVEHLQERIIHQVIGDNHGEVAARIVTILTRNGHLESDSLAEAAMVPAKDTRELLHRLYRGKYIDLFTLNTSRQHNPSNMIYLWAVIPDRIHRNVTDNVCKALLNLRLRRQHQIEIGKNWIERAQEAGDMDENDHEADKLNHRKFCLGLERLYNSCLQLDETLMVLADF